MLTLRTVAITHDNLSTSATIRSGRRRVATSGQRSPHCRGDARGSPEGQRAARRRAVAGPQGEASSTGDWIAGGSDIAAEAVPGPPGVACRHRQLVLLKPWSPRDGMDDTSGTDAHVLAREQLTLRGGKADRVQLRLDGHGLTVRADTHKSRTFSRQHDAVSGSGWGSPSWSVRA